MDVEQAAAVTAYVTGMTTGWNDDSSYALTMELAEWADADCAMIAARKLAQNWNRQGRPPLGVLHDYYIAELRSREQEAQRRLESMARIRCEGSGWYEREGVMRPCPTCNRATHQVWQTPGGVDRYRDGEPLRSILGVSEDDWKGYSTLPCRPGLARHEPNVAPERGREVAMQALYDEHGTVSKHAAAVLADTARRVPVPDPDSVE